MSSKNIFKTFGFVPDVKSTEKLRHEHEVETTTSFVMYYSYGVGEGKSKVRGASQMSSSYERECYVEGAAVLGFWGDQKLPIVAFHKKCIIVILRERSVIHSL